MGLPDLNVLLFFLQIALLNPIENPQLELAIVMLIVPFFVNVGINYHFSGYAGCLYLVMLRMQMSMAVCERADVIIASSGLVIISCCCPLHLHSAE